MHANARLTPRGRLLLCQRVAGGRPVAHVAVEMGVSRATGYKWVRRLREEGLAGLVDRSCRPGRSPTRTPAEIEAQVLRLRRDRKLGPARIAGVLGLNPATVHRVLVRHGLHRLAWLDRPTGQLIRRYERARPGELVHVDVKRLGRIPDGGGWRAWGRPACPDRRRITGWEYVHAAVDDHTRLAYAEIHPDEKAATCAGFLRRAAAWFTSLGIDRIERVMTDNAWSYRRSTQWRQALADLDAQPRYIRPYRPQTNGKAERFNRTLTEEWAYQQIFTTNTARAAALTDFLHTYNHHRAHTALDGQPPISRVNNLPGHYT